MDSHSYQSLTEEEKLKVNILNDARKLCKEVGKNMEVDFDSNSTELIAEVVWKKLQLISSDLEQFANHGKRSTINCDDVKLLARRNPDLKKHLAKKADELTASSSAKEKPAATKRKRKN